MLETGGDNTIYPAPYNSTDMKNYLATETGSVYDISEGISGHSDPYNLYNDCDIRVAKADFLKLKMVALSYSVPQNVLDFLHISSMLVRFQVTNLFTIADKNGKVWTRRRMVRISRPFRRIVLG